MDRIIEAYAQWPPFYQLLFAVLVLVAFMTVIWLSGAWVAQIGSTALRCVLVLLRGWPPAASAQASAAAKIPFAVPLAELATSTRNEANHCLPDKGEFSTKEVSP